MQESVQMPSSACPRCGYVNDAATGVQDRAQPGPGDYSVCLNCAGLSVFGDGMQLRMPTSEEEAAASLEVARVQLAIRELHRTKAWKGRK